MVPKTALLLASGYLSSIVLVTATPLLLDPSTASLIAVGPLLYVVLLTSYLAIHYLGLRSILRWAAYFLTFVGLVMIPSGIIGTVSSGHIYSDNYGNPFLTTDNSTIWADIFDGSCVLASGVGSSQTSTGYYGLAYAGTSTAATANCYGVGQLASEAYASGVYGSSIRDSSIWFEDRQFQVPPSTHQLTTLYISGIIHAGGWLADHTAGIGFYHSQTNLDVYVKITGTAPCSLDSNCYGSQYDAVSWTGSQTMDNDYTFSGLMFTVATGYSYSIIVSYNETSWAWGAGLDTVVNSVACFGYSRYCTTPENGPSIQCNPVPSSYPSCGLLVKQLTYKLTNN